MKNHNVISVSNGWISSVEVIGIFVVYKWLGDFSRWRSKITRPCWKYRKYLERGLFKHNMYFISCDFRNRCCLCVVEMIVVYISPRGLHNITFILYINKLITNILWQV